MAALEAREVTCLAVSKDGNWIAAGTQRGVVAWDAKTYERKHSWDSSGTVCGVDFSPDSTRLVASSRATIVNLATGEQVLALDDHEDLVVAAKYSPRGDRIATATRNHVRLWDSNNGRLLTDIPVHVTQWSRGLVWFDNHVFVVSYNAIKKVEGSTVSEWPVPETQPTSSIAISNHGEFIAYSTRTRRTITFWDMLTRTPRAPIQHPKRVYSIALSPDDQFLAITGEGGKITIKRLSHIMVSIKFCFWVGFCYLLTRHTLRFRNQPSTLRMVYLILGGTINS